MRQNADIAETRLQPCELRTLVDGVHLQTDEPPRRHVVDQVRCGNAVDEGANAIAQRFDPKVIPFADLESRTRLSVTGKGIQPLPALLIVDSTAPRTRAGVDLHLVAKYHAVAIVGPAFGAHHDPGVESRVHLCVVLQNEIAEGRVRDEKTVRGAED